MTTISPMILEKYNAIINLCMRSRAYYRHTFCGTRNKSQYLKIVTKKGMYFSPEELSYIDNYVTHIAGSDCAISANKETGSLSITLYEPGRAVSRTAAKQPPNGNGRVSPR